MLVHADGFEIVGRVNIPEGEGHVVGRKFFSTYNDVEVIEAADTVEGLLETAALLAL